MRTKQILSLLTVAVELGTVSAAAQMYPGQDVTVNPAAIPPSQLLQPGQPYPGFVLIPPSQHRHYHHRAAPKPADETASNPPAPDATAEAAAPPPPKPHKERHVAQAAAPAVDTSTASAANPVPFTFGEEEPIATTTPTKVATTQAPPAATKTGKLAAAEAGLTKRGAIIFEHSATDPQPAQMNGIKLLAGDLNSALEAGATQIQLQAFGGTPGDRSSDARRISLKRALAIRQILIDNGVPSGRIDVRAMGGATDSGEPDRVDVYVRAR